MDLSRGFELEDPAFLVPWRISQKQLRQLFGDRLRKITRGYFTISCTSLGGLQHELGFHFEPRIAGKLRELEFFRKAYPDQEASYRDFQLRLENAFGAPTIRTPGDEGFPYCEWRIPGATIRHHVYDRFGLEEHVRIRSG